MGGGGLNTWEEEVLLNTWEERVLLNTWEERVLIHGRRGLNTWEERGIWTSIIFSLKGRPPP